MKHKIKDAEYYFDDDLYQLEVESKGCLIGIEIEISEVIYTLSFYDSYRFKSDIDEELENSLFVELTEIDNNNIIFLKKVTKPNVLLAIESFVIGNRRHPCKGHPLT